MANWTDQFSVHSELDSSGEVHHDVRVVQFVPRPEAQSTPGSAAQRSTGRGSRGRVDPRWEQPAAGTMPGYVWQEVLGAGRTQGLLAAKLAQQYTGRKDGKIVIQNIQPGHFALETRAKGTGVGIDEYNQQNGTTFSYEQLASSTNEVEASSRIAAKWAADGDQIVGWASTDFTHGFVGNWAKQNGLVGKFSVGGFDLTPIVMTNIGDGSVDWTVAQNPYAQGGVTSALTYIQSQSEYAGLHYDAAA